MFRPIRLLSALLIFFAPFFTKLSAVAESAAQSVTPQMMELIHTHQNVLERMNTPGGDGKLLQLADARMRPLLTEGWRVAGERASAWLDRHPDSSAKDLNKIFVDFTPPPSNPDVYDPNRPEIYAMEGFATRIAADAYVVTAAYEPYTTPATATFFVVARGTDGHFQTKWGIKPLAQQHYRSKDEIGLWAFLDACAYYCGPLVVDEVLALPPSENGQPRFAVDAYQSTNGNTLMKQLSVWQWNGTKSESLLIRSYQLYIDEDRSIQLIGNLLTVPTKERTSSFSSFGCCAEPRGIWIVRLAPDKVEDLGHRFLQPQIQWADRLLAAGGAETPAAATLASPSVLAFLRHAEVGNMIDQCNVQSSGKKGAFEISFGEGVKLWLAYRLRNGQPYFTGIRVQ